jgi:EAL domain-containing protein (putative c-di-GMP-specific phosphodiesterase class I)
VEQADQAEQLRRLGSEYVQGFLFSRPLPVEEVDAYIAERALASRSVREVRG